MFAVPHSLRLSAPPRVEDVGNAWARGGCLDGAQRRTTKTGQTRPTPAATGKKSESRGLTDMRAK